MLALIAIVPFLSQSQREGIVGLSATAVADVGAIAWGPAVASSLRARLTVIIIDVVLVPKVVPATATSRIAALVTRVAMMTARFRPPATIGVLLEHSMGEMQVFSFLSHIVTKGISFALILKLVLRCGLLDAWVSRVPG